MIVSAVTMTVNIIGVHPLFLPTHLRMNAGNKCTPPLLFPFIPTRKGVNHTHAVQRTHPAEVCTIPIAITIKVYQLVVSILMYLVHLFCGEPWGWVGVRVVGKYFCWLVCGASPRAAAGVVRLIGVDFFGGWWCGLSSSWC